MNEWLKKNAARAPTDIEAVARRNEDIRLPLAITMGEPAGIGGEILLKAWLRLLGGAEAFVALDDPGRLERLARALGLAVPLSGGRFTGRSAGRCSVRLCR